MTQESSNAWRCEVCGYIHRGSHAPEQCPICGVPKEQFTAYSEQLESKPETRKKTRQWRCLICNYIHTGDQPPDQCPVCAAPASAFEAVEEAADDGLAAVSVGKIVVIGSGIAGISTVEAIRQISKEAEIILLSKEKTLPYYRLNLTRLLAGEINETQLTYYQQSWYRDNRVELVSGAMVTAISAQKKSVTLLDGKVYNYDKLVIAAGAHAFVPPVSGANLKGVTTLRDMDDARYIIEKAKTAKSIVIVGGGILGMEIAGALAKTAKPPTLLERFKWVMPRQLNRTAANLLAEHVKQLGIDLRITATVKELIGTDHVSGVKLESGETIEADLVIISAGIRANSFLARQAGLHVNRGIVVNDFMQTSDPDIYAAGDIAEHRGVSSGLWNDAQYQGSTVGMNVLGKNIELGDIPRSNTIKVLGIDLLSIGRFNEEDGSDSVIEDLNPDVTPANYCRFIFRDSHLQGAILIGNTAIGSAVKKAIEKKIDFSALLKTTPSARQVWDHFAGT